MSGLGVLLLLALGVAIGLAVAYQPAVRQALQRRVPWAVEDEPPALTEAVFRPIGIRGQKRTAAKATPATGSRRQTHAGALNGHVVRDPHARCRRCGRQNMHCHGHGQEQR